MGQDHKTLIDAVREDGLSEKAIKKLKQSPPNTGYDVIYDTWKGTPRGFGLRVTASGVASFFIEYRFRGRKRRFTIGKHPELSLSAARDEAITLRHQINKGEDPAEKRASEHREPTVDDLGREYLERHAKPHKRPSSLRNDDQMLNRIVLPRLGKLRVTAVNRRDIESLHLSLKDVPYRGNRVLSLLSKMFSLAVEWHWRPDNPVKSVKRFDEVEREAWLTEEQLEALAQALDQYPFQDAADAASFGDSHRQPFTRSHGCGVVPI